MESGEDKFSKDFIREFVNARLKQLGMTQQQLADKLFISRVTLNKYLSLAIVPAEDTRQRLYAELHLSPAEIHCLGLAFSTGAFDDTEIRAWKAIDSAAFENAAPQIPEFRCYFYHDNIMKLAGVGEMMDTILPGEGTGGTPVEITIINSVRTDVCRKLLYIVRRLCQNGRPVHIDHYIAMNEERLDLETEILLNVMFELPAYLADDYHIHISSSVAALNWGIFSDCVVISMQTAGGGPRSNYWISFSQSDDDNGLLFNDPALLGFIESSLKAYKKHFVPLSSLCVQPLELLNVLLKPDPTGTILMSPDLCALQIPPEAFASLRKRFLASVGSANYLMLAEMEQEKDFATAAEHFIDRQAEAAVNAAVRPFISVCSAPGLKRMAETRHISGLMDFLPPFTAHELKLIFSGIIERSANQSGPFRLYIVPGELFGGRRTLTVNKKGEIFAHYLPKASNGSVVKLRNERFTNVIFDYVSNWMAPRHAMPRDEAVEFLRGLMDGLE
jgi:transcriptional regulator with XRE-family HTH domain